MKGGRKTERMGVHGKIKPAKSPFVEPETGSLETDRALLPGDPERAALPSAVLTYTTKTLDQTSAPVPPGSDILRVHSANGGTSPFLIFRTQARDGQPDKRTGPSQAPTPARRPALLPGRKVAPYRSAAPAGSPS